GKALGRRRSGAKERIGAVSAREKPFLTLDLQNVNIRSGPVGFLFLLLKKYFLQLDTTVRERLKVSDVALKLEIIDSRVFRCYSIVSESRIVCSTRVLEVFWIISHLNFVYYDVVFRKGGIDKSVTCKI